MCHLFAVTFCHRVCTPAALSASSDDCMQRRRHEHNTSLCFRFSARVELSVKVLDTHKRLQSTLAHELCHVAAWIFDHVAKPPHGKVCGMPHCMPSTCLSKITFRFCSVLGPAARHVQERLLGKSCRRVLFVRRGQPAPFSCALSQPHCHVD